MVKDLGRGLSPQVEGCPSSQRGWDRNTPYAPAPRPPPNLEKLSTWSDEHGDTPMNGGDGTCMQDPAELVGVVGRDIPCAVWDWCIGVFSLAWTSRNRAVKRHTN